MMRKSSYQQPQQEAKQYKSPIPNLDEEARPYENEFQKRRLDIPNKVLRAPQTYWPLEEPGKGKTSQSSQIKHNLFDERKFVNGQLGGMSAFLEDPTRLRTPLHDVPGEKTPLREFLWFERWRTTFTDECLLVKRTRFRRSVPKRSRALPVSKTRSLSNICFGSKGLCVTCEGAPLAWKGRFRRSFQGGRPAHARP